MVVLNDRQTEYLNFDLYTRNHLITYMVNSVRDSVPLRVLDVGGREGHLKNFLNPQDRLFILDPGENDGNEADYYRGDVTIAPFPDASFDVVIASDTYEHIPHQHRRQALLEMLRVSKEFVIVAAPFDVGPVSEVEELANNFFKTFTGHDHPWLREHLENRLPCPKNLEEILNHEGYSFTYIEHNNLANWLGLQCLIFYAYASNLPQEEILPIHALYNSHFAALGDFVPPCYRRIYFISKGKELPALPFSGFFQIDSSLRQKLWQDVTSLMSKQARVRGEENKVLNALAQNVLFAHSFEEQPQDNLLLTSLSHSISETALLKAEFEQKERRLKLEVEQKERHLQEVCFRLSALENSLSFKALARYRRWHRNIFPAGSKRRHLYNLGLKTGHIFLNEGFKSTFLRGWRYLKRYGLKDLLLPEDYHESYLSWIEQNEPKITDLGTWRQQMESFSYQPLISIIIPVFNVDEVWLRAAVESVCRQIYSHWELCVVDNGSHESHIKTVLEDYRQRDSRIKVFYLGQNQGVADASNVALNLATGDFIGLLDHDDELAPQALFEVVKMLNEDQTLDFIYSDEDKLEPSGQRSNPFFKPDFSPDLLMAMNYINHFSVFRRSLVQEVGGFRPEFEGSQDYDLILRLTERTRRIAHIPKILYHWRKIPGSVSADISAKTDAHLAAKRALEETLLRRGHQGRVTMAEPGRYRVRYELKRKPLVSIIIPTRDRAYLLRRCIASIHEKSTYRQYEIVVVDNESREAATHSYFAELRRRPHCRVLPFPAPFNYAALNNFAARETQGDYLLFLNNDTEIITPEWMEEMLSHAQRPEVGAVGAKLLFPNKTIQHGGVIVGLNGVAGHAFYRLPSHDPGYMDLATVVRNCSAVTAACLMMRREVFEETGGFDEKLDVAFNDVALCLQILQKGYYIVWTPYTALYHQESASRGPLQPERNIRYFCDRWRDWLNRGDPFYNPNLAVDRRDFMIKRRT